MKKFTFYLGAILCMMVLLSNEAWGQSSQPQKPQCKLTRDTIRIDVGQSDSVKVNVLPKTDTVAWKSKNPLIATVKYAVSDSTYGKITGVNLGTTEIVVTSQSKVKDSCVVIVYEPVTSVELKDKKGADIEELFMTVGSKATLYAKVNPSGANKKVRFSSLSGLATVNTFDTLGVITAGKQPGKVKIVVTAGREGNLKTDTCLVHIINPVTEVSFPDIKDTVVMHVNHKMLLHALVKPADADDTNLAWSVEGGSVTATPMADDTKVARIESVAPGISKVTAMAKNGKSATCVFKVLPPAAVAGLSLDKDTLYMAVGERDTLTAKIFPSDAFKKKVKWLSTNAAYAAVTPETDTTAVVLAKKLGIALIVAESLDGSFKDTCYVSVLETIPVKGVDIDSTSIRLAAGKKDTLKATIKPANATNKKVVWTSGNTAVVTVDSCYLTGVASGETWVYVRTVDGGFRDSCKVTIYGSNANEKIVENVDIWSFDNSLRIRTDKLRPLAIYTISGALYRKENAVVGERIITLPKGVYIVVLGDVRKKIFVQ
ncbi:Ig-like domain-containing protein [Tannerella sp.]|uniref:Ig-like domain-containing protein n=1 Tax=Tannerella sp. TaxID=2382127 RepID=UPI0026DCD8F4|nr:Ig-like domain-containing protein [Tannerella sp.]MDO4704000.1 Ig-like domain-containing protein [Tannerella sp.]